MRIVAIVHALIAALIAFAAPATAQTDGALLAADPVVETPAGMQAWRIRYRTRDQDGRGHEVTGMVIAPREAQPPEPRRVIAWAHGTSGVAERCALSTRDDFFAVTPGLSEMIRRGYVVVAPDYPGLGSDMPHPYLVGVDTANSVLDAVRAAREIPGAFAGGRFAVWGESQGGHAALWTAIQARSYTPDLTLVGTAAAAPPTDLAANLREGTERNVRAMLLSFIGYSWNRRFDAPLSTFGNRMTQGVVTRLARNNCIELDANPRLGTILGITHVRHAVRNTDFGQVEPWASLARANSVSAADVPGPVLIAQSVEDPVIAPAVTREFARALCRGRTPVRWISLPGGDHAHSARDSAEETLDWIDARFAGAAPVNDCASI